MNPRDWLMHLIKKQEIKTQKEAYTKVYHYKKIKQSSS